MTETSGYGDGTDDAFAWVRLELQSRPESITLVRSTLSGLGEYLELEPELLDDLKTAVSEACNNVVLHAYGDEPGPLDLFIEITPETFEVRVRDQGAGIQRVSSAENRMGVGLAVISALAHRAEFQSEPGEGTEVRMSFQSHAAVLAPPRRPAGISTSAVELPGDIVATVAPVELLGAVMGRLVRAVAAGAHFAIDRFPSLHELTEAISAAAVQRDDSGDVGFSIVGRPRRVELRVGPLPEGSTDGLLAAVGDPDELAPLIDGLEATPLAAGELLHVDCVEPRR